MNLVCIMGRLTKEPIVNYAPNTQMAVAKFNIALDRGKDKNGKDRGADFPNCVAFGRTAENLEKFSGKGLRIQITGHLQTGSYDDKDGKKVYTTDVIADRIEFIDWKNSNNNAGQIQAEAPDGFEAIGECVPF